MGLKHKINHEATVNGITYKSIGEEDIEKAIDFYFDVFLQGKAVFPKLFKFAEHLTAKWLKTLTDSETNLA